MLRRIREYSSLSELDIMDGYDEKNELINYIWNHYAHFFTPIESKAAWASHADAKARAGYPHMSDVIWKRHQLADDPAVMAALADGIEVFRQRTADRVLRDHPLEVFVNRCTECKSIVRTPEAQQCLWCGFSWHPSPGK